MSTGGGVVLGVDGARAGWLVAVLPVDPGPGGRLALCADFTAVRALAEACAARAVGVDMPLGLAVDGPRAADIEARRRLGGRRSTLFPTPSAAVLEADDHAGAVVANRIAIGSGISVQAWNLVPRIRELRAVVAPAECDRYVECHPETSFVALAGRPLAPKSTAVGVGERIHALTADVPDVVDLLAAGPAGVAVDDALDALAAAWSARRLATGQAERLGDGGVDLAGYPLAIVV